MVILRAGQEVLGMSTGRIPPGDNETWSWNEEVKDAIRARKQAKKKWETPGMQEERVIYRQATKAANKEVAISKAHALDEVYKELETPEGERKIYRIAKARDKSASASTFTSICYNYVHNDKFSLWIWRPLLRSIMIAIAMATRNVYSYIIQHMISQ